MKTSATGRLDRKMLGRIAAVGCLLASTHACTSEQGEAPTKVSVAGPAAGDNGEGGAADDPNLDTGDSVLQRNNHASRDGHFLQPMLSKSAIAKFREDENFEATFDGDMRASLLFLADGPNDKGVFFGVTTQNDVIAFDEASGAVVWSRNIGDSPTGTGVPCGAIHPLGIISTPVIDAASRTIYVAGAIGTDAIKAHEIHALSVDDGTERDGFPIDVTGMTSGDQTFDPPAENQRGALSIVGGKLYVAYGGHSGDCGNYHGWVVAVDTADPSKRNAWATLGAGEGIWAAGGLASDGKSLFAITGNSTVGASDRASSDSEQVLRLTGLANFDRSEKNLYYPTTWKSMDGSDADFGASNAIYLSIPGSTPRNYVAAVAKDGHLYLLNSSNLGGMNGQVVDFKVSSSVMGVRTVPASYTTAKGVHFVLSTSNAPLCGANGPKNQAIVSVLLTAGSPPSAALEWCAPLEGQVTAPIATTTDGTNNATVWYTSDGHLTALDGDTGEVIYASADECENIRKWTSPIAVKGRIVVGAASHLCSWSAH